MDVGTAVRPLLMDSDAVTALIGTRAYPLRAPDEPTTPYVIYRQVSGAPLGKLKGKASLKLSRVQISCWADDYAAARAVATAVKSVLEKREGAYPHTNLLNEQDQEDDATDLVGVALDFEFWTRKE